MITGVSASSYYAGSLINPAWKTSAATKAAQANALTGGSSSSSASSSAATSASASDDFLKYAKMSPIQRVRADYLKNHGLTEESLAKLDPALRKQIETEIKNQIKKSFEQEAAKKTSAVNLIA